MTHKLDEHHLAWLSVHKGRTEEWLARCLADGFDVHHMDGNHENNDPGNLVLIEAADHMYLHNGRTRALRKLVGLKHGLSLAKKDDCLLVLREVGDGVPYSEIARKHRISARKAKRMFDVAMAATAKPEEPHHPEPIIDVPPPYVRPVKPIGMTMGEYVTFLRQEARHA